MNEERTKYILEKLQRIFKDGYRPSRKDESYSRVLKPIGVQAGYLVNCMGHACFNLRNQQFIDYDIKYDGNFYFGDFPYQTIGLHDYTCEDSVTAKMMLDFIKEVGLKVEECAPNAIIKDFKSWKIALYFCSGHYHYLLEETPKLWSSKNSFKDKLEYIHTSKKTEIPKSGLIVDEYQFNTYSLYGTYKITNEKADESNPYINLKREK